MKLYNPLTTGLMHPKSSPHPLRITPSGALSQFYPFALLVPMLEPQRPPSWPHSTLAFRCMTQERSNTALAHHLVAALSGYAH